MTLLERLMRPPCEDNDDLGGVSPAEPQYVANSAGLAQPRDMQFVYAVAPTDAQLVALNPDHRPRYVVQIRQGQAHVVIDPYGQQFALGIAGMASATVDATYITTTEPLELFDPGVATIDPRVAYLKAFWRQLGYDNVRVHGCVRRAPTEVLGQFALVKVLNRWHTPHGIYGDLGQCWVVREFDGTMRFLKPAEMRLEFTHLVTGETQRGF